MPQASILDPQAARSLNSKSDKIYHILSKFRKLTNEIQSSFEDISLQPTYGNTSEVNAKWMDYCKDLTAYHLIEHYFVEYLLIHWVMEGTFGSAERFQSLKVLDNMALQGLRDAIRTYAEEGARGPYLEPMPPMDLSVDIYQQFRPFGQLIRPDLEDEPPSPASSSGRVSVFSIGSDDIFLMEKDKDAEVLSKSTN